MLWTDVSCCPGDWMFKQVIALKKYRAHITSMTYHKGYVTICFSTFAHLRVRCSTIKRCHVLSCLTYRDVNIRKRMWKFISNSFSNLKLKGLQCLAKTKGLSLPFQYFQRRFYMSVCSVHNHILQTDFVTWYWTIYWIYTYIST